MRITSKGQVTIPREIRERFGFAPLSEVDFVVIGDHVELRRAAGANARVKAWLEAHRGSADAGMTSDEVMRLTRGEQ